MAATPARLILPDSLVSIQSIEDAIESYCAAGLRPVLIHAPNDVGGCTCGQVHEPSKSGSTSIGKHPIANNWQKHIYTRDELRDQRARLKFTPNIGIVLGEQPGGEYLIAVDVDDADRFAVLESQLGSLPETPRCDSGRGYRLIYQAPPEVDVKQFANRTGLGGEPGVDVKIKGGQIVVAPSRHASGNRYFWPRVGIVAPLPVPWALELVQTKPPEWAQSYTPHTIHSDSRAKKRAEKYLESAVTRDCAALASCGPGMRNTSLYNRSVALFSLCAGLYLGAHWSYVHDELFRAGRSCGLPEAEVRRTLGSAEKFVRESGAVRSPMALADAPPSVTESPSQSFAPAPEPDDPRPIITVTTELDENVNAAVVALRLDDNIYQREGQLVFVARVSHEEVEESPSVPTDDDHEHKQLVDGSPQIRAMSRAVIKGRLSRVALFRRWVESKECFKPILPPDDIVAHVHDMGEWPTVRVLEGVIETPTMRADGEIVQTPGYDRKTRYLYVPSETFPSVHNEAATQENATWAMSLLKEVFDDFPYAMPAHRYVPIAAIMTLIARPAILGSVPAFLFDASTRGSGKTLQTDAIATITTGRGAPRMNYTSDEVELEKILGAYALKGSPFICLDNIPAMRPFGGGPLDRVLTARDKVELRVLGRSEVPAMSWRAVILATGNNIQLFGDTARRSLMARLEPADENPERRTKFRHDDLLAYIKAQRARLVSAALLILRAYYRAGRPNMGCARWGSFEEWSRLIPNAIVFAGGEDPMKARPECDEDVDTETRAIKCFVTRLYQIIGDDPFRVSSIIDLLFRSERKKNESGDPQDELDDIREAVEALVGSRGKRWEGAAGNVPDPHELGKRLSVFRGRVINGLRLTSKLGQGGTLRWRIVPTLISENESST